MPDNPLDLLGGRRVEEYRLDVRGQRFIVRFQPCVFFEHYSVDELFSLVHQRVYEVSFARVLVGAGGRPIADFGMTGGGNALYVLGGVAQGIVDWARRRQPDYLYWWAQGTRRRSVYDRIVRYFAARGSGLQRRRTDPFTGRRCRPGAFWVSR